MARNRKEKPVTLFGSNKGWAVSSVQSGSGWTIILKNRSNFGCHFIIAEYRLSPSLGEISDTDGSIALGLNYVSEALANVNDSVVLRLDVTRENGGPLLRKAKLEIGYLKAWGQENIDWMTIDLPAADGK